MPEQPAGITLQIASSLDEVTRPGVPHVVDFIVLQLNDVYEAGTLEGGRRGGLARVATLQQQLRQENPSCISVLVGDFLSPSAIGSITGDGGQNMVDALNAMELTYATIGNHEFDIARDDLLARIAESRFKWVSSNVTDPDGKPFSNVAKHEVVTFSNAAGEQVRVALVGFCIDMEKKSWVRYQDPVASAREQLEQLAGQADLFLAMTHLTIAQDKALGAEVPRLDVLLGGHEHEAATAIVGEDSTPIFKADSNARSACIHRFRFDTETKVAKLFTELRPIDDRIPEDAATAAAIAKWQKLTFDTLRAQGNDPTERVGFTGERLDGNEADVRRGPTNLTNILVGSFLQEVPDADAVIFPVSVIRIDGSIGPGDVSFFDVVRIFPINCRLSVMQAPGSFVRMLLDMGEGARGTGGYSVRANVTGTTGSWQIKGEPLVDARVYKIVFGEIPAKLLAYPPFKGSGAVKLYDTRDVRAIVADYFRRDLRRQVLAEQRGKLVVNGDEWTLSDAGFEQVAATARFAQNIGSWFTGGKPGRFHVYSNNFGVAGERLAATMRDAGHTWTVGTEIPMTLESLRAYDGVFLAGNAADNDVLTEYVRAGGCVYLAGGTGWGDAVSEARRWKTFLNAFGLKLDERYDGIDGQIPTGGVDHPLLAGVDALLYVNGNEVIDIDPVAPENAIVLAYSGKGQLGVFDLSLGRPHATICDIRHTGLVPQSEADEYVELTNSGHGHADISGWKLSANEDAQVFVFPPSTTLRVGEVIRVYTNQDHPEYGGFSFRAGQAIWSATGGVGRLLDAQDHEVARFAYGDGA